MLDCHLAATHSGDVLIHPSGANPDRVRKSQINLSFCSLIGPPLRPVMSAVGVPSSLSVNLMGGFVFVNPTHLFWFGSGRPCLATDFSERRLRNLSSMWVVTTNHSLRKNACNAQALYGPCRVVLNTLVVA